MLTRFSVEGFKSFGKKAEVNLGQVNVFIGANGSGKTTLLEAIGLLGCAVSGEINDHELQYRGVRPGLPDLYLSSVKGRKGKDEITFRVDWSTDKGVEGVGVDIHRMRGRDAVGPFTIGIGGWYDGQSFPDQHPTFTSLADFAIYTPSRPVLQGVLPDPTQRDPVGLCGGRLAEAVQTVADSPGKKFGSLPMDEVLELLDWVERFEVTAPSADFLSPAVPTLRDLILFTDRRMKRGRNRVAAQDASEGTLYVLFLLVMAMHPRVPPVFAVDTFDRGMHPRLARETAKLFCRLMIKGDRQALLTTHNPLVLDGLDITDERIRLFAVDRDNSGCTVINRVEIDPDFFAQNKDRLPLSKLWVSGRLGGVPNL